MLRATLAFSLAGCASVPEHPALDPRVELTVDWQACYSPTQAPYYSVDLLSDGTVRYRGWSGVRERNERATHIDPARTARLVQSALKIMRESPALSAPPPPGQEHSEYCMTLRMDGGPTALSRDVSPLSRSGKAFERQLQRSADLRPWVCPARSEAVGMGDSARCQRPVIQFTYSDRESCGDFHAVNLYRDGQVHYYSHRMTDSDHYYKIAPQVVTRLVAIGWKYESAVVVTHARTNPDADDKYIVGGNMVEEYKQSLTQLAQVPWLALSKWRECTDGIKYPQGQLSLHRR
jgi:hypothetical protein